MIDLQGIMGKVEQATTKLKKIEELKMALGRAMTDEQTEKMSAVIDANDGSFERWLETDGGRMATRTFVDRFINRE